MRLAEIERLQFSCDLHDGVLQHLVGAKMMVESLRRKGGNIDPASFNVQLIQIESMLRSAVTESRHWIGQLRGENDVSNLLLQELFEKLSNEFRYSFPKTKLYVDIDAGLANRRLAPDPQTAVFRMVQEALRNGARHGKAKSIHLSVSWEEDDKHWSIDVQDDGLGFDPNILPEDHYGVSGMRLRAELIQADLTIRSELGKGTLIRIVMPEGFWLES